MRKFCGLSDSLRKYFLQGLEKKDVSISFETLSTNGIHLHTALAGPKDGEPVFLLHGFPEAWFGWKARPLALIMLGLIPVAYAIGIAGIKVNSAPYAPSQAAWGGTTFMLVYLAICLITFIAGVWTTLYRKKKEDVAIQA